MEISETELKNLRAQVKLMSDIITNDDRITHHLEENGKKLMGLLKLSKINEKEEIKTVTLTKENFDKILDIVYVLQEKRKWDQLGILASTAVPDNEIKKEILNLLK